MKAKILIVEDEMIVAQDMREFLSEQGFAIVGIATSAEKCFQLLEQSPTDVVLMDIRIKGNMTGIEAAIAIKENHAIPVIFITANNQDATLSEALKAHPAAIISKPFHLCDIKSAIQIALNKKEYRTPTNDDSSLPFFVKQGNVYKKIAHEDVIYIKAEGSYSKIVTDKGSYTLSCNLVHVQNRFLQTSLKRVHRSYIINAQKVSSFDDRFLWLEFIKIPYSQSYISEVREIFKKV